MIDLRTNEEKGCTLERGLQEVPSFSKAYSDGKRTGLKSKEPYQKYSKSKRKMEASCENMDRGDV